MFVFAIAAMSGAVVLQLLFPDDMASHSAYRVSYGWQREIAVWDIAVLIILIAVNLKYDAYFLKTVLLVLIVGGIGIGTNHLVHFLDQRSLMESVRLKIICLSWDRLWAGSSSFARAGSDS